MCGTVLQRIIVRSREDVRHFRSDAPYAVITFVGHRHGRTPPKLLADPNRLARIIICADDTYPNIPGSVALSKAQALRIARFVKHIAPQIDTLVIQCRFGHGRSCGAAIAVARAFRLRWQDFIGGERVGNGHVTMAVAQALESVGYDCDSASAAEYDRLYTDHVKE